MEDSLELLKEVSTIFLNKEIERNRNACTYIFYGREGSYHLEIALYFIQNLICKEDENCKKSFYEKFNPSIHVIEPNEEGTIKREEIKLLINEAAHSSFMERNFFIINSIENIREEGWNTLLKTLEEPLNSIFILISKSSRIPKTLLSRALLIDISPSFEKIEDKILFEFFDANLRDYINFKESKLELEKIDSTEILKALDNYYKNSSIKNKAIFIKSIDEFVKNIIIYNKIEKIIISEKIENMIGKDKEFLKELFSLIIDRYSKRNINNINIEKLIFLKECIYRNVNISLILINFLVNLS